MLYLNYYIYRVEQVAHRVHTSQNCFCRVPPYTTAKCNPWCYYKSIMISKTESFLKIIYTVAASTHKIYIFNRGVCSLVSPVAWCPPDGCGLSLCGLHWVGIALSRMMCSSGIMPFPSGVDCVVTVHLFRGGVWLGERNCKLYYMTVIHILYTYDLIVVLK